jgi:hypothetical protein
MKSPGFAAPLARGISLNYRDKGHGIPSKKFFDFLLLV